jgi:hypothetical protein
MGRDRAQGRPRASLTTPRPFWMPLVDSFEDVRDIGPEKGGDGRGVWGTWPGALVTVFSRFWFRNYRGTTGREMEAFAGCSKLLDNIEKV